MSIPLDRLYHYIESVAQDVYGDTVIYRFYPHGSKNIDDLENLHLYNPEKFFVCPEIICYDQEPLNFDLYQDVPIRIHPDIVTNIPINMLPKRNIRIKAGGNLYDKCILLHSEQNSSEVMKYRQSHFIPVYYWNHALLARDWFRYAPYVKFKKDIKKTFLIYNRAWTGTREYRLKFIDLLIDNNLINYSRTSVSTTENNVHYRDHTFSNSKYIPHNQLENFVNLNTTTSCYSADFNITDYQETEFEVVLETLFDDNRWHLTEKILRPIACKQPFILASTPGSLKCLQNYGFKTFHDVFDERYDSIRDPLSRLEEIIKVMKQITSWSHDEKESKMKKINEIVEYNNQHFFSDRFYNSILEELKTNLSVGLEELINTNTGRELLKKETRDLPGLKEYLIKTNLRKLRAEIIVKARAIRNPYINK